MTSPFQPPAIPFPDGITDRLGYPLTLGSPVTATIGRRNIEGEVVGWLAPNRVRVLTTTDHMHTIHLDAITLKVVL